MPRSTQTSLFGGDTPDCGVSLVEVCNKIKPQNKSHAAFHRLVKQIEQQRAQLQQWLDYQVQHNRRVGAEYLPIQEEYWQHSQQLVLLFDEMLGNGSLKGKSQRAKLRQIVVDMSKELLVQKHDDTLVAVHDKYSDISHAEERDLDVALSRELFKNLFGIEIEADESHSAQSMDELFQQAEEKIRRSEEEAIEQQQSTSRKNRKTTKAQVKREEAAKEISQSVRDVYRKLASALHPDRETDDAARKRKTELMQRTNQAYEAGDLLTLLNLQLEVEQIDADHLANLSGQRLLHYTKVLQEQSAELKHEINVIQGAFAQFVSPFAKVVPAMVENELTQHITGLKVVCIQIKNDLENLRDPKKLSAWLKGYQLKDEFDDLDGLDMLLDDLAPFITRRPKRRK